ncbi:TonB-dependent siderophore receptor [Enterobacter hormaechei]|nr:TonB-dependent siderophore receptor [Enterobacter hormaechei]
MKIITAHKASLPLLFVPVIFGPLSAMAADEQTLIVSATPQTVSELDTPAAVSVVSGEDMRHATPRINLSESLGSVPGLQIQNRQNYAQDLQLSVRGFGALNLRRTRDPYVRGRHSGNHARRPGADIKH